MQSYVNCKQQFPFFLKKYLFLHKNLAGTFHTLMGMLGMASSCEFRLIFSDLHTFISTSEIIFFAFFTMDSFGKSNTTFLQRIV